MFSLFVFMDCIRKYKCAFSYFPIFFSQTEINGPEKSCFVVQWHWVSLFNRCTVLLGFNRLYQTLIYNLISVSQITGVFLGEAIISSETDPHNGSKKEKRSYGKIKNNKTMIKILPFIRIFYLKQQSSILWCFSRLKFEKVLFRNTFFSFIFRGKMIVHTAEKDQIRYSAQN